MAKEMTLCPINNCRQEVGLGTMTRIRATKNTPDITIQVCEDHWQAVKDIGYVKRGW